MPSPASPEFHLGPLTGHWYGLLVALGCVVFGVVTAVLWRRRGGSFETAAWLCLLAVPAALVGARAYHLLTTGSPGEAATAVDEGGLGLFGAVAAGGAALVVGARVRRLDAVRLLDCAAPGLAFGQALGRVGNWFNQELYGRPTDLPWGLHIDAAHRLPAYAHDTRFHPTFLYEGLWDLALGLVLLRLLTRDRPLRRGLAVALWLVGYGIGRALCEGLRAEPTNHLGALRLNQVVGLALAAVGAAMAARLARSPA